MAKTERYVRPLDQHPKDWVVVNEGDDYCKLVDRYGEHHIFARHWHGFKECYCIECEYTTMRREQYEHKYWWKEMVDEAWNDLMRFRQNQWDKLEQEKKNLYWDEDVDRKEKRKFKKLPQPLIIFK